MDSMIPQIEKNAASIRELCRRYGVARLEIFGSAAEGAFDPEKSDVDFIVDFFPDHDLGPWLAHYFDLANDLAALLECKVDLVMAGAPRNPWFLRELNRTRKVLYDSKDAEVA